ncbi:MAG: hypothetical protein ACOH2R_08545 [Pseudomonas sp.]
MAYETLGDLIKAFRDDEKDTVAPYFWSDGQLTRWVNEGLIEFAEATQSIFDEASDITLISYGVGQHQVALDPSIMDVVDAWIEGQPHIRFRCDRFTDDYGRAYCGHGIRFDETGLLHIHPTPVTAGAMRLKVLRRPYKEVCEKTDKIPDVLAKDRRHLLLFMAYRAYNVSDGETFDKSKSNNRYAEFLEKCQEANEASILRRGACSRPIRSNW